VVLSYEVYRTKKLFKSRSDSFITQLTNSCMERTFYEALKRFHLEGLGPG